jgi:hypothetical protein
MPSIVGFSILSKKFALKRCLEWQEKLELKEGTSTQGEKRDGKFAPHFILTFAWLVAT